jgi:hypothetical protein
MEGTCELRRNFKKYVEAFVHAMGLTCYILRWIVSQIHQNSFLFFFWMKIQVCLEFAKTFVFERTLWITL